MSRYARQMILPEVGAAGQARLARAHVLVIGAGGLGAPVLQYLAGAGIGRITLLDPDTVEESNLHRQVLFSMADIGQPKVSAARKHLLAANPGLTLHTHVDALSATNVQRYLASVDLVVDAADSFATSYILSDACLDHGLPFISASVLAQRGYVGGFCSTAPSLRALFPELPESAASCASAGVMGPMVGVIGALQAQMALKTLLQHSPSPLGRLIQIEMTDMSLSSFDFHMACEPENPLRFTSPELIQTQAQVIDLRPIEEAPQPATPSARRILPEDLATAGLVPEHATVLCCRSGVRAWRAARSLRAQGFEKLEILALGDQT
ncbi:HesA/MoeB/ThiF family protein [Pseudophaeobacter sp.]|uniref:HesA/MoeB/ThiF family protein n=1 Tax=Pseudophaeobacter sp. TaxID=1971739 RepID=UPI0032988DE8